MEWQPSISRATSAMAAVALKVLRSDLAAAMGIERFQREVAVTAALQHPHILSLFDSGESAGRFYYVTPYVDGESLREKLEREGQLPVEQVVEITREVADALDYAHRQGIVHRDIKPANVLLAASGRGGQAHALVADFGIARATACGRFVARSLVGWHEPPNAHRCRGWHTNVHFARADDGRQPRGWAERCV